MNNQYIIPANSKKSQLILGFFTGLDLTIFIIGMSVSGIMLMLTNTKNIWAMVGMASPALIAAFLVAPVPNYHNVMTFIGNINRFYTGRKKYYWRGWCCKDGNRNK